MSRPLALSSCNYEDGEGRCTADDGFPCEACEERTADEAAYWLGQWRAASPAEKDPAKYERDMVDAGRGEQVRR
jgi:hypothetical protein